VYTCYTCNHNESLINKIKIKSNQNPKPTNLIQAQVLHQIFFRNKNRFLHIIESIHVFCDFKLDCDSRFQRAFIACSCVLKVSTLVWANQRNYFENATACSKRMRKTLVATQLYDISALLSYKLIFV